VIHPEDVEEFFRKFTEYIFTKMMLGRELSTICRVSAVFWLVGYGIH